MQTEGCAIFGATVNIDRPHLAHRATYHRGLPNQYRRLLARNVADLMRVTPELGSHAKLAMRCSTPTRKIGASTIRHLLNADDGPQPQLDTIVAVAEAFKVPTWMLLHPEFDAGKRSVGGEMDSEVVDLARKIAVLSQDTQRTLMEVFNRPYTSAEPVAHISELHEPTPGGRDRGRKPGRAK